MRKSLFFLLITLSLSTTTIVGQRLNYAVEFNQFLDNREYSCDYYEIPQTMLGARLNAMLGAKIDSMQGFMAGANYLYEYGDRINGNTPTVNLFYYYQKPELTVIFGSFPRRGLLNYPVALLSDTLDNYRPNIQGAYIEKRGKWGCENVWCDWIGRQRADVKESFLAGLSGKLNITSAISLDHYFYMFHKALYSGNLPNDFIRDNGAFSILASVDLTKPTHLDLLSVHIGTIGCYDRQRPDPTLHFYMGLFTQVHAYYKNFGIDASYYKGGRLRIANGDGLYRSGNYGRIDLAYIPIENKYVTSRVALCFHDVEGQWQNSQMLSLIFKLGAYYKGYHENHPK